MNGIISTIVLNRSFIPSISFQNDLFQIILRSTSPTTSSTIQTGFFRSEQVFFHITYQQNHRQTGTTDGLPSDSPFRNYSTV